MDANKRLEQLGITLPEAPGLGGVYSQYRRFGGNLVYISGCTSKNQDEQVFGRLGDDLSVEQGQRAARLCALNILAIIRKHEGDLNRVKSFVKILGFVACTDVFVDQPKVMNGASQLFLDVFGEEAGLPARSAIGTNALPGRAAVEVEALIELVG